MKLTLVKADWTWNGMYQDQHNRVKKIVIKDACMKFCNESRPPYLETDALDVGIRSGLLQVKDGMNCGFNKVPHNVTLHLIAFTSKRLLHTN